jgi:hypothetical protein
MQSEIKLQSTCFLWFHNTYPNERGLLCYNLNNSANKIQGNQNKALGLIKGRSDMVYYKNGKAIMIEFKTETGTQKPEQKDWEEIMTKQGFEYHIIRSFEQFQQLIWQNINQPNAQ